MGSAAEPDRSSDLASTMLERIAATTSHSDALKKLRTAFPDSPLAARVAALELLRRRGAGEAPHIPR
jgi:hypothetical protein